MNPPGIPGIKEGISERKINELAMNSKNKNTIQNNLDQLEYIW
jgi:hypothetical protein